MTDQAPVPPPGMPNFERPPSQAGPDSPTQPVTASSPAARPTAPSSSNVLARRPWVVGAGLAGAIVVAGAAGYGYGRTTQAPTTAATTATSGSTNGVTVDPNTGSSGGSTQDPYSGGGSTQDPFSGGGSGQFLPPGSGSSDRSGQFQLPGSGSTDGSGQTQVLPGDPSGGFSGQPGTVSPDQGGPTTSSRGS